MLIRTSAARLSAVLPTGRAACSAFRCWVTIVSPSDWLPDGRLIYAAFNSSGRSNPYIKSLASDAPPLALGSDKVSEYGVDVSPDGRWMAFQADPTRRMEVYLRRVDDRTGASTIGVSTEGGTTPRWRSDGRELLYLADSGKLMSVTMKGLDPPQPGPPTPMFDPRLEPGTDRQYNLSRRQETDRQPHARPQPGFDQRLDQLAGTPEPRSVGQVREEPLLHRDATSPRQVT